MRFHLRSLDHDCLSRRQVAAAVAWTLAHPEEGAQPRHVQPGTGPVHHGVEGALHRRAVGEDQVAAVLDLKDRVGVAEAAAVLLGQVQAEAQACGVDPTSRDLAQAPYSPRLGQGVCDLSQALRFTDPGETVALLREADARRLGGAGDVLVAVEDDLGAERWMPSHLDRQVSPGRVHDVERVVVDVLAGLLQVANHSRGRAADLPHRRRRLRGQYEEHPTPTGCSPGSPRRSGACVPRPCRRSPARRGPRPRP